MFARREIRRADAASSLECRRSCGVRPDRGGADGDSRELPIVFPVHPRTRQRMAAYGLAMPAGVMMTEPLGYIDFLSLTLERAASS